jgi:hypothetical protein
MTSSVFLRQDDPNIDSRCRDPDLDEEIEDVVPTVPRVSWRAGSSIQVGHHFFKSVSVCGRVCNAPPLGTGNFLVSHSAEFVTFSRDESSMNAPIQPHNRPIKSHGQVANRRATAAWPPKNAPAA